MRLEYSRVEYVDDDVHMHEMTTLHYFTVFIIRVDLHALSISRAI